MSDLPPENEASRRLTASKQREVRIVTGSRLHFGLLDTVDPFGGAGAMIDGPVTEVIVTNAERFEYVGHQTRRGLDIAKRAAAYAGFVDGLPQCRIEVVRHAPAHRGLGSGTQLSIAVAEGICRCLNIEVNPELMATEIAQRGKRSAIGVHGYFGGGLILEAMSHKGPLNAVQQRIELPKNWCVAILCPALHGEAVHGVEEVETFATLAPADDAAKEELRRIACEDLIPSAEAGDFDAFASSVHGYNRSSGMLFASIQGGPYNGPKVSALIDWLIDRGVTGVGQSSWGPGVFAWFESTERAEPIVELLPSGVELIAIAAPKNEGRTLIETD